MRRRLSDKSLALTLRLTAPSKCRNHTALEDCCGKSRVIPPVCSSSAPYSWGCVQCGCCPLQEDWRHHSKRCWCVHALAKCTEKRNTDWENSNGCPLKPEQRHRVTGWHTWREKVSSDLTVRSCYIISITLNLYTENCCQCVERQKVKNHWDNPRSTWMHH